MERGQRDQLQKLMVALAEGDRSAFDPIFQLLWPVVHGFAARALGQNADTEDAAQVALMKVLSRATLFDPTRDALSWVLGIIAYECKTFRQKQKRRREEPPQRLDDLVAFSANPEERLVTADLEAAALEVLGTLRPTDIETLQAVANGHRPDIASATFRKRVERAIGRLRAAWRSRHGLD